MKIEVNVSSLELLMSLNKELRHYTRDFLEELHDNIEKELIKRAEKEE